MFTDRFFNIFTHNLGVSLGTSNIYISVVGKGIAVREPTVVARNKKSKVIVAVGEEAKKMIGRTPSQLEAIRPLSEGVISDFDATVGLLSYFFNKLHQSNGLHIEISRPKVAISVPTGITDVEKKAVQDAALNANARQAYLVEEPLAAALGAKLPIFDPAGVLLVNIGGGSTEISIISLGGIVINKSLKTAGDRMDESIINYLRLKYSVLIGLPSAENLKIKIGSATDIKGKEENLEIVRGRDLSTGLPKSLRVSASEIREALVPHLRQIVSAVSDIIEQTPPELLGDITQKGIYLSGGVSQLAGLGEFISEEVKIPCQVVADPLLSVVRGCAMVLEDESLLKKVKGTGGVR